MADFRLDLLIDLSLGYAGVHQTLFEALRFLVRLQPADLSQVAEEDRVCVICGDPQSENTGHNLVQLDCGHFFGRSCLLSWLTPLDKEGDGVTVNISDDGATVNFSDDGEEEEDEGPENASSRTRQSTAELPEVRSQSTSPWRPVNGNPDYVGPSSLAEGQEVVNQQIAFLEALQASTETLPRQRGIRDPIYTYRRHSAGSTQATERGEQLHAAPPAYYEFDDPMARSAGQVPLTRDAPSQEPPQAEDIQSIVVYPLFPGNNTCPLCRAKVFRKPVHGDSLQSLRVRIRAWDLAYKYTCIERNALEDDFRSICLAFGHIWDSTRAMTGEVDEVSPDFELKRIFHNAASTLVALEQQPELYFSRQWTDKQRQALQHFGRYMKFREEDMPVWFSTDASLDDVSMIQVWTGPDRSRRLTRRSRSNWVQVRIKDHPNDFRLGSDDEEEELGDEEEDDEDEDEDEDGDGSGREREENEVEMPEEDGNEMTEDSSEDHIEQAEGEDDEVMIEDLADDISSIVSERFEELEQSEGNDEVMAKDSLDDLSSIAPPGFEKLEHLHGESSDDLSSIASEELEQLEQLAGGSSDDLSSIGSEELEQLEHGFSNDGETMPDAVEETETEVSEEGDDAMDLDYDPGVEF
ncbi:MAG: hypothetical protein LQ343_000920 [Gyalolechia ehrenbergii]|nr:MAG: hypothetical protein LQ343_000920 [Gyalolechia ehrenbergii]